MGKSAFGRLKAGEVPLTPAERKLCMERKAVWHHGPGGAPSPAVAKSRNSRTGDVTYFTATHRAFATAPTIKGAIRKFHEKIKQTS